jgi:hypothetical protein
MDFDFLLINIGSTELYKLAPEFENRGYKVGILSGSPRHFQDNEEVQKIFPYWHINDIILNYKNKIKYDENTINNIKHEFNVPSFHTFYFPHMFYRSPYCGYDDFYKLSNDSENEILFKKTVETFQAIKFFFEDNHTKCTIQNLGGEILRRVIFFHNQKYKIPHFFVEKSPIPEHFVIFSEENGLWDELKLKRYEELSEIDLNSSKKFIEDFKSKKTMVKLKNRNKSINYEKTANFVFNGTDRLNVLTDYVKKFKKSIMISRFYQETDFNEKFIYFPLHYHVESRLTLRDPHCWRQEFIVEYVARSIPQGYKLYVKPHPEWPLDFPYDGLKLISDIDNVKLIDPSYNSVDLIKKSDLTVVINSNAGLEALIHEKPVVSFGTEYYSDNDMVYKVNDLRKLPELIENAIANGTNSKDLICFVDAFLKANRKGDISNLDRDSSIFVDMIIDHVSHQLPDISIKTK